MAVALIAIIASAATSRSGDSVALVGDSITVLSRDTFERELKDYKLEFQAKMGARSTDMVGPATELAATKPTQVVINLGTNDALRRTAPAETKEQLTKIVGLFPDADCIHFVNINTHITDDGDPRKAEAEQVNAIIDEVADKAGADVIDWDGIVAPTVGDDGKSSIIADTVHPKDVGEAKLANAIGDALDRCGRPWKFW